MQRVCKLTDAVSGMRVGALVSCYSVQSRRHAVMSSSVMSEGCSHAGMQTMLLHPCMVARGCFRSWQVCGLEPGGMQGSSVDWSFGPVLNMTRTGSDGSLGLHTPANGSPLVYNDSHKVASLDSVHRAVHLPGESLSHLSHISDCKPKAFALLACWAACSWRGQEALVLSSQLGGQIE